MPINWYTKKINIQTNYKIIRRTIVLNANDGTHLSGYRYWQKFKKEWTVNIIPVEDSEKYREFFAHLKIEKFSEMAWGITGQKVIWWFVTDSRDFRIMMQNVPPGAHEFGLHAILQDLVGTFHITRKYDNPEGRMGTRGPAATVIAHDIWYGSKKRLKLWIFYGIPPWVPITIPHLDLPQVKKEYGL